MKNLTKRTLSGIAFIVIIVGALLAGPLTFYILFFVITGLCLFEFYSLAYKSGADTQKITGIITGLAIYSLIFLNAAEFIENQKMLFILPFIYLLFIGESVRNKENPFKNITYTLAGLIYPVLFLATVSLIAYAPFPLPGYNYTLVLSLFVLIWSNDTFAYITGKKFGKNKLSKSISPKKSWEGLAGGFIFSLMAALVIYLATNHFSILTWVILAIIASVGGTFGDLTESAIKRSAGVKESGNLIPGHGGALDRFDSAIFVFPLAYFFLKLIS